MNPPYHAPPQSTAPNGYGRTIGLTKPRIVVLHVADARTDRPADYAVGRVGASSDFSCASSAGSLAEPRWPDLGREDHRHAVMQFGAEFARLGGDNREAGHPRPAGTRSKSPHKGPLRYCRPGVLGANPARRNAAVIATPLVVERMAEDAHADRKCQENQ